MGEARRKAGRNAGPEPVASLAALVAEAEAAHRRGEFASARKLCERIVAVDADHPGGQHLLGLSLIECGERDAGVAALRRAVELEPANAAFHFNLALALRVAGDFRGAADGLAELSRRFPEAAAAHLELATTLETLGETAASEAAFRRAIKHAPGTAAAHAGLARTLFVRGALDEAIAAQKWAVALDPRAIDDGRIGSARGSPSDASRAAEFAAVAACRAYRDDDVAALVAERELRVIDDFEADFPAWRAFALAQKYTNGGAALDANFPGVETAGGHALPGQMQRIADALGRDIKWRWPANGAFRLSFASSQARSDIHVDEDVCRPMYAGVLYLSLPEHCRGGTSFWRHRETGWSCIPPAEAFAQTRYPDFREFQRREVLGTGERSDFESLTRQRTSWERVVEVPMRANRLIVYRSDFFHAISEVFGTAPENARLVQLFFFEPR